MMRQLPDFQAKVCFFGEKEGGRKSPVFQGYRPDLAYKEGAFELFMIWPRFLDTVLKERKDGDEVPRESLADFWIANRELKNEVHRSRLKPGVEFWMCEGQKRVAEVVVTEILAGLQDP